MNAATGQHTRSVAIAFLIGILVSFACPSGGLAASKVAAWGAGLTNSFVYPNLGQCIVPSDLTNVLAVAAGEAFSMALKSDGTVIAWGDNSAGQTNVPADLTNAVAIAAGYTHGMALKADGKVAAWGSDSSYESEVPIYLSNVVAIAAGQSHSLALQS